jgi:integrase
MSMVQGIQKRTSKKNIVSYRVQIRESDGFPPKSKTFPTLQEAKDWQKQEKARRRQGYGSSDLMNGKKTLIDLIDRYEMIVLPTKPKDARNMKRHLDWWRNKIGKYGLTKISSDLIAQCRQELAEGVTSKKTKRSHATVNRYLATLSTIFTYAINECGWITDNPCRRVAKFTESKGRDRILAEDEFTRLFEECKNSRNEHLLPVVVLAVTTGMRRGEILGLTWDCIDLDRQTITLKETKNGKQRTVSIVGEALELLRSHCSKRNHNTPFVFPAKKRFGKICIRKAWEEAVKRAGIKNLRLHDLRHTFCTYASEAGASNLELATAMGHQTLQMLLRYTHMNEKITHRLSSAVDQRIFKDTNGANQASETS